jgi:hypothetical protein
MPEFETWQWILGSFCAFMIGVSKTGMPGIGAFTVPLMILTVGDARLTAAWTVPMLTTADIFAVSYWRRHAEVRKLITLIPWVAVGMAGGALALSFPESVLRPMVGGVILVMVLISILRKLSKIQVTGHSSFYGIGAGFATTIANAAGPVMSMYLLASRLPKEKFIATGAWFFLVVNLSKIPIYIWHDLYSRASLTFALMMVPAVVAGNLTGVWLVRRVPQHVFEMLVIVLTAVSSIALLL